MKRLGGALGRVWAADTEEVEEGFIDWEGLGRVAAFPEPLPALFLCAAVGGVDDALPGVGGGVGVCFPFPAFEVVAGVFFLFFLFV